MLLVYQAEPDHKICSLTPIQELVANHPNSVVEKPRNLAEPAEGSTQVVDQRSAQLSCADALNLQDFGAVLYSFLHLGPSSQLPTQLSGNSWKFSIPKPASIVN